MSERKQSNIMMNGDNESDMMTSSNNENNIQMGGDNESDMMMSGGSESPILVNSDNENPILTSDNSESPILMNGNSESDILMSSYKGSPISMTGHDENSILSAPSPAGKPLLNPARKLSLCVGNCRLATNWQPMEMTLEAFLEKLSHPLRTPETTEAYRNMPKDARDKAKDHGGFLAGRLMGTRRKKSEVLSRSMVTLDYDQLSPDFFLLYPDSHRYFTILYTTHSHLPEAPRARIIYPLVRDVTPQEYDALARYLAQDLAQGTVDPCSFEVQQMMYWPTVSADGEYRLEVYDGPWLDPDVFLAVHEQETACTSSPASTHESPVQASPTVKQQDPLTKPGIIGAFCRAYSIQDAICTFLPQVYAPTDQPDRYDYLPGEGHNGVVIYEDKFLYSHHATDPAGSKLLNAFDLVRLHRFGKEDESFSYRDMCAFALQDEKVQKQMRAESLSEAEQDFGQAVSATLAQSAAQALPQAQAVAGTVPSAQPSVPGALPHSSRLPSAQPSTPGGLPHSSQIPATQPSGEPGLPSLGLQVHTVPGASAQSEAAAAKPAHPPVSAKNAPAGVAHPAPAPAADPSDGWSAPLPLELAALPPFPLKALPPVLRNYAGAVAESTQTAQDMACVAILTAVSACMRNLYKVEGKADWLEPTNLYSLLIADPSERKSAVLSLITKPIDEYVRIYNEQHKLDFEMSRAAKQRLENKRTALISDSKKSGKDKKAADFNDELQDVLDQLVHFNEQRPMKVYVDDITPEKLVETLAENQNALSIISSEGGIFDILSGSYSNKVNIDVFLKAYSGERIAVERIMRNAVSIDDACLTILLSVQPVVISELMQNDSFRRRGLNARFLYTLAPSMLGKRVFHSKSIPCAAYEAYRQLIFHLLQQQRGDEPRIIRLSPSAQKRLKQYYLWVEEKLTGEYSFYGDWIGKLVGNTLRIAGVLTIAETACTDKDEALLQKEPEPLISGEIMDHAILIGKYFFQHAIKAYSAMSLYTQQRPLNKIIDKFIEKELHLINKRELLRLCQWIPSTEQAQQYLNTLEETGYIRLIAVDPGDRLRGGRPRNPTYAINPMLMARA